MLISLWSVKGGSGTTVTAASLALHLSHHHRGALLVDLAGDVAPVLGLGAPTGPGVVDWLIARDEPPPDALARLEIEAAPGLRLLPAGPHPLPPGTSTGSNGPVARRAGTLATILGADPRPVVVDAGLAPPAAAVPVLAASTQRLVVTRPCYLSLRRSTDLPVAPTGAIVIDEPGRALRPDDVEAVLGVPVVGVIPVDPAVARAVDAGLLAGRVPRSLQRVVHTLAS